MKYFLLNLFLAMAWTLINGEYGSVDFLIGFIVGFLALGFCKPLGSSNGYFRRFKAVLVLIGYFFYELIISVTRVVWDVITPKHLSHPDIIYVPLTVTSDLEITLLANMVSLTPGSLSLDVTQDRQFLIVHIMFALDQQQVIDDIKNGLERRLLEVTSG